MVEENKKMLKVDIDLVEKPTTPEDPRRSTIHVPSRPDNA